jgi:hypothetical protein
MLNELLLALDPAALTTDGVVGWLYPEKKMSRKRGTASSLVFINGLNGFLSWKKSIGKASCCLEQEALLIFSVG